MKKVLLIEDNEANLELWEIEFKRKNPKGKEKLILVTAQSVHEAREQIALNQDVKVIVFDGTIPNFNNGIMPDHDERPNTRTLVYQSLEQTQAYMIAASDSPHHCDLLVEAGCHSQCRKEEVPQKVLEFLNKQ